MRIRSGLLWILVVGILLWLAQVSHAGIVSCSAGAAGGPLASCTGVQACLDKLPSEASLVRTLNGTSHLWQKWSAINSTAFVRMCMPDDWNTKAGSRITVDIPAPPPPPAPPANPVVLNQHALWWEPVQRDTGEALIAISGYRVYHGASPGVYDPPVTVTNARMDLAGYAPGRHYFAVASLSGTIESAKSVEIAFDMPEAPKSPEPPVPQTLACDPLALTSSTLTLSCRLR